MRTCVACHRSLGHADLLDSESQFMEAARLSMGLDGVCFRYYTCPRCGHDHVFLEVTALPGETGQEFQGRKEALARDLRDVTALRTSILVVAQAGWQEPSGVGSWD
jgi:hypothetical protein